jgi:hypothetical protein
MCQHLVIRSGPAWNPVTLDGTGGPAV